MAEDVDAASDLLDEGPISIDLVVPAPNEDDNWLL